LLEERLRETEASLTSVTSQNERLASTLREARDQIVALKEEVDRLPGLREAAALRDTAIAR
jgi:proteasome-associated ATPase